MKLLIITSAYAGYLSRFYARRPDLLEASYRIQKEALEQDAFGWGACWRSVLSPRGCESWDIVHNAEPLQRAWGREHGIAEWRTAPLKLIALRQAQEVRPDLLWFDDYDEEFLKALRSEVPSIRKVLGWVGSALPSTGVWGALDLILSCAPESVVNLRERGFPAREFPHSYDPRINERLVRRQKRVAISFVGQLMRSSNFHLERDTLLEEVAGALPLEIYSASAAISWRDEVKALVKGCLCRGRRGLQWFGCPERLLDAVPPLRLVAGLAPGQCSPVNPRLKPLLRPAVYGLEMFQLIADSRATLNIHADSSPRFASNMRLFETTGAGGCLVTDWKENLGDLFDPENEVVSYRSAAECREKMRWLLDHPVAAQEIADRGQMRTLANYTFAHRADLLLEVMGDLLSGRKRGPSAVSISLPGGDDAR